MPATQRSPSPGTENGLLAALPPAEYERLRGELEQVYLPLGTRVWQPGSVLRYAYFPTDGLVSLLYLNGAGETSALAVVGAEGMLGVPLFMGSETSATHAVVVGGACWGYRIPASAMRARFGQGGAFQSIMLKYALSLFTQISQTAVCNLHHTVEQQLCRWLLHSMDRMPGNRLHMTQELIADMLGVRRQGVGEAAGKLAQHDIIAYSRGLITVLNHNALLRHACECYGVIRKESDRLLGKFLRAVGQEGDLSR